jgi:hypothetical protein
VEVDRRTFEYMVAKALDDIPAKLGRYMENVAVIVEDWPTRRQLAGRRGTLLGLYEGVDLTRRSPLSYGGVMPDKITIFRGPISSIAHDEGSLRRLGQGGRAVGMGSPGTTGSTRAEGIDGEDAIWTWAVVHGSVWPNDQIG